MASHPPCSNLEWVGGRAMGRQVERWVIVARAACTMCKGWIWQGANGNSMGAWVTAWWVADDCRRSHRTVRKDGWGGMPCCCQGVYLGHVL